MKVKRDTARKIGGSGCYYRCGTRRLLLPALLHQLPHYHLLDAHVCSAVEVGPSSPPPTPVIREHKIRAPVSPRMSDYSD